MGTELSRVGMRGVGTKAWDQGEVPTAGSFLGPRVHCPHGVTQRSWRGASALASLSSGVPGGEGASVKLRKLFLCFCSSWVCVLTRHSAWEQYDSQKVQTGLEGTVSPQVPTWGRATAWASCVLPLPPLFSLPPPLCHLLRAPFMSFHKERLQNAPLEECARTYLTSLLMIGTWAASHFQPFSTKL